jgi:ectoine hydroxylase-related dioxygenase (phytanoyl-CoA dioxygenase family)
MAELPRLSNSATAEEVAAALHAHGGVIIERLIGEATCDLIAEQLAPWLELTPLGADDFTGLNTRRTGGLLTRCPASAEMIAHPLILDVCNRALWPGKTSFQLHLTQAIAIGPDSPAQFIHRDHWCFDFFPFPSGVDVEVSTMWALTDFTEANGATRVVPDTHRLTDDDAKQCRPTDTVAAEMPKGSILLYLGSTVHGGGANLTDDVRIGINVDYILGFLRQEENQYLTYTLDEVREMPERIQRLLGYQMGAYALGYIEGGRDPMEILGQPARNAPSFGAGVIQPTI